MRFNIQSVSATLTVAMLLLATVAGTAAAAQPTLDTTADTNGSTDIDPTVTVTYNESDNASYNLQWSADSSNTTVTIKQGDDVVHEVTDPDTAGNETDNVYNTTIQPADDLGDVEAEPNETVPLNVTIVNNTAAASPDKFNFTFDFENTEDRAYLRLTDTEAENDDTVSFTMASLTAQIPYVGDENATKAATVEQTTNVSGTNTSVVTLAVENATVQDSLAASMDSETEDGDWLPRAGVKVNGHYIPAFKNSVGSHDWLDSNESYATVSDNGQTVKVYTRSDVLEDTDEADIKIQANDAMGFRNANSMFSGLGMSDMVQRIQFSLRAMDYNFFIE